ncbi:MAG: hypothetical protein K2N09_07250 [Muribaculaceae bacterium]|nr:hypothetical protein [Muribaculaceae bacterium]
MNFSRFHIFRYLFLPAVAATASGIAMIARPNAPLEPIPFELPEVKVTTRHRPILHMTGYIRELSTMSSSSDTLTLYREKWVDFMIPTGKEKHYKGWTDPRLLKTKSYYKWTDQSGRDSVSDRANHHFSWSDWVSLPRRVNFPAVIGGTRIGTDTVMGRYSPSEIWRKDSAGVNVMVNVLADSTRRKWTPRLAGPYWRDTEFERLVMDYHFSDTDTFAVRPQNLDRLSCSIESMGRGHDMFMFKHYQDPILYVSTYFDLTITDREYLTVRDARRKEKNQELAIQDAMLIFESERVPRDSIITDLIARVNAIDHDSRRLGMELDTRVGNGHIPLPPVYTKKDKMKRGVNKALDMLGRKKGRRAY